MRLSKEEKAYIAGFLDGDGSIHVRLKPNRTYRYRFQISPAVVFYQSAKEGDHLKWLNKLLGIGYIRKRNDGIVEFIVGDSDSIIALLCNLLPYLRLKKKQAELMLEIIKLRKSVGTAEDFLKIAQKIDLFQNINYSKKRIRNSLEVER
ncbi:MAG: LAGLIDADG family homing endonuclease, partial [Candidatus Paceibacterota bacterium]